MLTTPDIDGINRKVPGRFFYVIFFALQFCGFTVAVQAFNIGDTVQTTANTNVRSGAGVSYSTYTTELTGSIGTIINGSYSGDGYTWWYINWNNGYAGYSIQNYLYRLPPDIIAQSLSASPNPIAAGSNVTVDYTVKNQGTGNANQSTTRIQIKNASNVLLTESYFTAPALAPGASVAENSVLSIPSSAASGSYTVYIILDYNNAIGQSNVNNDIYSTPLSILTTIPPPATPYGNTSLTTNQTGTYSVSATDSNGAQVQYGWDWNGDGVVDEWSPLGSSGWTDYRSHSWASAGTYYVKVEAQDSYGTISGWSNAIAVTVTAPPTISFSLSPTNMSFSGQQSTTLPGQQLWINNTNTGTLNWTASSNQTWLTLSQYSGTGGGYIYAYASTAGLAVGTYYGTITISAPGATLTPQTVSVTFTVTAPPSPPSTPTPLSPNGTQYPSSQTSVPLSWGSSTGATSYTVQVGNTCGTYNVYNNNVGNIVNFTVTGISAGNSYQWRVNACNTSGCSSYSGCYPFSVAPVGVQVLTVNSVNPSNGVPVTVNPVDNYGQGNNTTPINSLSYNTGTQVTLSVPLTAGANTFQKWQKDGVDYTSNNNVSIAMSANYTMTAVYSNVSVTALHTTRSDVTDMALSFAWDNYLGASYVAALFIDSAYTNLVAGSSGTLTNATATYQSLSPQTNYYFEVKLSTETDAAYNVNRLGAATLPPQSPTITTLSQESAFDSGVVSTIINGTIFAPGTTVKLTKGGTDILGTVTYESSSKLLCDFNLSGAIPGAWDLVVTVPNRQPVTVAGAFAVLAPTTVVEPVKVLQGIFNPARGDKTYIATHLASAGKVTVKVYDPGGRLVRDIFDGDRNSGDYSDEWNGRNNDGSMVASGVYLVRIEGPGFKTTKRVVVVK